jgi:S1-C subfamily serine protease
VASGLTFSIDGQSVALIRDMDTGRAIGTAFIFIRPQWAVTARHVVVKDGLNRERLELLFPGNVNVPATVIYAHPELDLAVLSVENSPCTLPLFPAHQSLTLATDLITAGYRPSKNSAQLGLAFEVNHIAAFTAETRGRAFGTENLIVFDAPFAEGGHSGGPVFGPGGSVLAVVIENFTVGATQRARATALAPLVDRLEFRAGDPAQPGAYQPPV